MAEDENIAVRSCPGPVSGATGRPGLERREFLRAGLTGFASVSLAGLYKLRALAAGRSADTAVILVWLRGGASHLETFDPKPSAPSEYRGPYGPIETNVSGIRISELLPRLATIADRYTILRSMAHNAGGHPAGSLRVLSGDPATADKRKSVYPDWMSIASYLWSDSRQSLPNYVAVNPAGRPLPILTQGNPISELGRTAQA